MQFIRLVPCVLFLVCWSALQAAIVVSDPLIIHEDTVVLFPPVEFPELFTRNEDFINQSGQEDGMQTYFQSALVYATYLDAIAIIQRFSFVTWSNGPDLFALSITKATSLSLDGVPSGLNTGSYVRSTTNIHFQFSADTDMVFYTPDFIQTKTFQVSLRDQWGSPISQYPTTPYNDDSANFYLPAGAYELDLKWDYEINTNSLIQKDSDRWFLVYPIATIPEPAGQASIFGLICLGATLSRRRKTAR